ncbi:hypothetical protein HMPREF1556_00241 [Porphyromonas sp. oral taxon 278 str. W7784]|jgi:hypothetical protein|nr:hypothetical protein HMPREF1556_00241 [Porphyromonas sp. oral taxon 278 str. W7784]
MMHMDKDWGGSTLLASRKIKAGTRYYYIDAKLDSKGNKYIVLSETKLKEGEGKLERHRIFIYEEDFAKVSEALLETILQVSEGALLDLPNYPKGEASSTDELSTESLSDEDLQLQSIDLDWTDEA